MNKRRGFEASVLIDAGSPINAVSLLNAGVLSSACSNIINAGFYGRPIVTFFEWGNKGIFWGHWAKKLGQLLIRYYDSC